MENVYAQRRTHMVDGQLRTTGIVDHAILDAFGEIPREEFVPASAKEIAYLDEDLCVSGPDVQPPRFMMEPSPLAKLLQLAKIGPDDLVLDVGVGTGYSSAIISKLASSVIAIESDEGLAELATEKLADLGCDNVAVVTGDLTAGLASEAPYDVIMIQGAVEEVPEALTAQLKEDGRLVVVIGHGNAAQAHVFTRHEGRVTSRAAFNCAVKPLPGFHKEPEFEF